jgi:uncharacterized protein involved in response to NO
LAALFACDVFFFVSGNRLSLHIALFVIAAMISLVGGRVIPAFTVAALRQRGEKVVQTDQLKMDIAALVSWAVLALVLVLAGSERLSTRLSETAYPRQSGMPCTHLPE